MLVEDEYLIAADLSDTIERHGGAVVGPAPDLEQARALLTGSQVHGAILDLKLAGETSLPLVDELVARGTPVILVTGYSVSHIPEPYDRLPSLTKPLDESALLALIEDRFRGGAGAVLTWRPGTAEEGHMKRGYKQMLAEAERMVESMPPAAAQALLGRDDVVFVDLRDIRELEREGMIPGAFHAPRGMLEFWIDPESPYHKPVFAERKRFVLYCASGWRSALAARTAVEMGLEEVSHLAGGFTAWREAGGTVAEKKKRGAS